MKSRGIYGFKNILAKSEEYGGFYKKMKSKNKIKFYFEELQQLIENTKVFDLKRKNIDLESAVHRIVTIIIKCKKSKNTIFFVGNGGSASIASHMATDFIKNGKMRSLTFNDSSLLTCISNDLGYEYVFSEPIGQFAQKGDVLFSISSSGKSANILNSVDMARKRGCFIVTLSGFSLSNPLSYKGDLNLYVNSKDYGHVEIMHLALCHYISDIIINRE